MMDHLSCGAEFKFADNSPPGSFNGYASVFGAIDDRGDMVAPGAFGTSLAERKAAGRGLPMYMQHGAAFGGDPRPVGIWDSVEEDDRGLKVAGRMLGLDTETGKYNYALVQGGAVKGLSIGYRPVKVQYGKAASDPKRTLQQIKLFEISLVDDPMLASARVDQVKSARDIMTIREFEDFLRDAGGYSRAAAKAIAASGFKAQIPEPRDEDGLGDVMAGFQKLASAIRSSI